MCLLPAAIVLLGMLALAYVDEQRNKTEITSTTFNIIVGTTVIFAVLGILFRN